MIKVSVIEPVGGHGGMNYYDFGLCSGLGAAGCDVVLYTCDKTDPSAARSFKVLRPFRKIYGASPKPLRALFFTFGLLVSLLHSLYRRVDVVHLHFFHAGWLEWLMLSSAKALGFKAVITVHDVESFSGGGSPQRSRKIFSKADGLIVHNLVSLNELVVRIGIDAGKVNVIRHGNYVDSIACPDGADARQKLGLPKDSDIVLFFGQIKKVKGLELLLLAFAKLLVKRPSAVLVIAGKVWKDDFEEYEKIISDLNIAGSVVSHIRYIPDEEAPLYYAAADVVALPYKKIYQSGVLLMAMSFGKMVVASDLDGMKEVVTDGVHGHLFVSEDADSLCEKLFISLASEDRIAIAGNGFKLVAEGYDWTKIGAQTHDFYKRLCT